MSFRTTPPAGAKELLEADPAHVFLDVRTEEEYAAGHVPGSFNVPVFFRDPARGMAPNESFVEVVERHFAKDDPLVLGCAAGKRSALACEHLVAAGFTQLVNMHGGFSGYREPTGEVTEVGWEGCGFPVERELDPQRSYAGLR